MQWRVIGTNKTQDWHDYLRRFPQADIYFLPEYHRAYELNGDGEARAFITEQGDDLLFYPFFMRPIERVANEPVNEHWYDIETVYGYSGPLCTTSEQTFLAQSWAKFAYWCRENRIIAEFIRFNPLLMTHHYVDDSCNVLLDRETVVVSLNCSEQELWKSYPSVQRNMVRKALSHELVCKEVSVIKGLSEFRYLYSQTMERVDAHDYYYFSDAYFNYLRNAFSEKVKLFLVRDKNYVAAAALFFLHGSQIHYHLASSNWHYRKSAPNNFLLHTVAQWGREQGFRWLYLGGGRTADPNDDLFRFKASISRLRLPFHIGKRVHNPGIYETLCSDWMRQKSAIKRPSYFLLYRL